MAEAGPPRIPGWRRLLARRRTRIALAIVLLLVVVRSALPAVLRRVVVSQADKAMVGRIEIDDIDLALVHGGFTLHGLRVYSAEAATAGAASPAADQRAGSSPGEPASEATAHAPVASLVDAPVPTAIATMDATTAHATAPASNPATDTTPSGAPARTAAASSPAPTEAGTGPPGTAPVLSVKRLAVELGFKALFRRIVELQRFELDGVAVSLDRARDGTLVLPAAAPAPAAEPTPVPSPQGPGWGVLVRSVALHDGRIGFRDFAIGDPPQRLDVTLPELDASQLALLITESGLQPGKLSLDAGIQDGNLHLDATIESLAAGPAYESHVVLTNVPIADSRVYIPKVGWSGLTGRLDADLVHRFESQGAHVVHGTAGLRDLDIRVAGLDDPALAWRRLAVDVTGIDFVAQHADVASVTLEGAHVVTRPAGPEPLPVLRGLMTAVAEKAEAARSSGARTLTAVAARAAGGPKAAAPSPDSAASPVDVAPTEGMESSPIPSPRPSASPTEAPSAAPNADATTEPAAASSPAAAAPPSATVTSAGTKPWSWTIGTVRIIDGHVQAIGGDGPLGVDVAAEVAPVTSVAGKPATVHVALAPSSGGTLEVAGEFVQKPLAFDGKLTTKDLQLAALTPPVANATTRLFKNGTANLDLAIVAGTRPNAPPDGVRVSGSIGLSDVDVAGDDPTAFAIRWKNLAVAVSAATAPGVLAPAGGGALGPFDVAFGGITLTQPDVTLTRTAAGIALPAPLGGANPAPAPSPGAALAAGGAPIAARGRAAARGPAASSAVPPAPARPAPAGTPGAGAATEAGPTTNVRVQADRVAIEKMRLTTTDTTVQPFFHSTLDPLDLTATAVGWPGPSANDVKLVAKSADGGVLTITGAVAPARTRLTAKLAELALAPFNPYAASTGYGVTGGTARLESTVTITNGAYDTRSHLVLHELGVTSGEGDALFLSKFGMPLELALSLLTDLQGNIVLDLPVTGDAKGARTGVGTLLANALTRAILNAVTSPLKLIGAVAHIGEKPETLAPQPLAFEPGRATLAADEQAKLASLGSLLGRAPGLRLHLRGEAGDADRRWLKEQALRAKLENESGVLGSVRHIGERGARKAVLAVLATRAEGKPADIPAEHREWFEAAVAEQQVDDAALTQLADARAAEVRTKLASGQGVDVARIVIDDARTTDPAVRPAVAVGLGAPAPAGAPGAATAPATMPAPARTPVPASSPAGRRHRNASGTPSDRPRQ